MAKNIFIALLCVCYLLPVSGQDKGQFSGTFQSISQFYDRDDKIGANTEVYKRQKSSTDAWLFMNYEIKGFRFGLRYDLFNNSPLLNPQGVYSNHGIGFWQISKDIDNLNITIGSFYDQFASGMIFRAYEDRLIGIDYAIQGLRIKYETDKLRMKGFSGQQKGNINNDRFGVTPEIIKGLNAEYRLFANSEKNLFLELGSSVVNRTLDQTTMNQLATRIDALPVVNKFIPKYNAFAWNGYMTLGLKNWRIYGEYCGKTQEAIANDTINSIYKAPFINKSGSILFGSVSYSKKDIGKKKMAFGASAQYKRIENFRLRRSPFDNLLDGMISYLPSITRQNTYRLLARYNSVVQEMGEEAIQAEAMLTIKKGTSVQVNYSKVRSLAANGENGKAIDLFNEYYFEVNHRSKNKLWKGKLGLQSVFYNQERYELKPGYKNVHTFTPFAEVTKKFKKNEFKSIRVEAQYLSTKEDLGSFVNAIVEYNVAPKWSFAAGDMVNVKPHRSAGSTVSDEIIHYYTVFTSYTHHATVFSLAYIKQVEGVNCTGGICRVEPAFSGVRFSLNTSF